MALFLFVETFYMSLDTQATDDSQFESGYSDEPTAKPVQDVKTEEKAEAKPKEETQKEEQKVDPIKELKEQLDRIEKGHTTLAGQFGGLQRSHKEIQEKLAAAQAATKAVSDSPTNAQVNEALKSPQEWEDLKSAFPEWALATEKFMEAKLASIKPEAPALTPEQVEKKIADVIERVTDTSLNAVFPGWRKEVATPEFDAWLNSQSDDVKALAGSDDVGDAARMLKLYDLSKQAKVKQDSPPKKEPSAREKQLKAAINPKGTGGHAAGRSEVDEFESGYNS